MGGEVVRDDTGDREPDEDGDEKRRTREEVDRIRADAAEAIRPERKMPTPTDSRDRS